jgi:YfiH family protein
MNFIAADWPAPSNVHAAATLRTGGVSVGPYASLNLGAHVGDDVAAVAENRRRVRTQLRMPAEPLWLNQVHGTTVIDASVGRTSVRLKSDPQPTADATVAKAPGQVCVVLTADCLPVVFCDEAGSRVAAAHAGWRGLAGGVLQATVRALDVPPQKLLAWLGPAIEQDAFEVGAEVREQFVTQDAANAAAFTPNARGRWLADLYDLARRQLERIGVTRVHGGDFRCYADRDRFFSYRRDGVTGRMGTMVWIE